MKTNWFITQEHIANFQIEDVIVPVDPVQLSDADLVGLRGGVRLRIEDVHSPSDLFTKPGARRFFRQLHHRWPLAAYFLTLNPINRDSHLESIIDLSLFMGMALCHVTDLTYFETSTGVGLRYDHHQLSAHIAELVFHAAELAAAVDYPATAITQREDLILQAVASFFEAGKALHHKPNKKRKRK